MANASGYTPDDGMTEYMICACRLCGGVWAMDYMDSACECDLDESIKSQDLTHVRGVDFRDAVRRYPRVSDEP